MRLTCPNCGARYEVDDSMIPAAGRDVQCSNCSTTWFQPGRRSTAVVKRKAMPRPEAVDAAQTEAPSVAAPETVPAPDSEAAPTPEAAARAATETADTAAAQPTEAAGGAKDAGGAPDKIRPERPKRRTLDPDVRDILRSEADREERLRRGAPEPVETQEELALTGATEGDADRARRRADLEDAEDVKAGGGTRRNLLPDIEEINSTLRASRDRDSSDSAPRDLIAMSAGRRRSGVRIGFIAVIAVTVAGVWIYLNPGFVTGAVPTAEPAIDSFVGLIDGVRFWLDATARRLAAATGG